jgi:ABC-type dipeptide/oligopeptide/nickel transport system permease component
MSQRRSIARRLFIGLSIVGFIGTTLLLVFIINEHRQSFTALGDPAAARHAFRELFEHVILPILVLIIPMGMASLIVIRKALAPLGEAVAQLQVAERH